MTETLRQAVRDLEQSLPELKRRRASDSFSNDLFEAVDYWCDLGRWALEHNTKVNYPERAQGQRKVIVRLWRVLETTLESEKGEYAAVLALGEQILSALERVQLPKDGHLGVVRIIRRHFQFLQSQYYFAITNEEPTGLRFSSGVVYVRLEYANKVYLSCQFGPEPETSHFFNIKDLLFMNKDKRYQTINDDLKLDSEIETEDWFRFIADVFQQYGNEALNNASGVFERLASAQEQRDREYVQEIERHHV